VLQPGDDYSMAERGLCANPDRCDGMPRGLGVVPKKITRFENEGSPFGVDSQGKGVCVSDSDKLHQTNRGIEPIKRGDHSRFFRWLVVENDLSDWLIQIPPAFESRLKVDTHLSFDCRVSSDLGIHILGRDRRCDCRNCPTRVMPPAPPLPKPTR